MGYDQRCSKTEIREIIINGMEMALYALSQCLLTQSRYLSASVETDSCQVW